MQTLILPSPVGLDNAIFGIKQVFNMLLEIKEDRINLELVFDKIYPSKMTEVIQ